MLIEIFVAIILGIIAGIITGLTPGIHINLISLLVLSLSPFLLQFTSPICLAIFIVAMAINHTFLDTCPSIFLGAPDSDTVLSVLPGHRLLLQGKGYEAVFLTVVGSLGSLILSVALIPILIPTINIFYPIIEKYIGYILLVTVILLILREKGSRYWALLIVLMSGTLGIITLTTPNIKNPLFPLLSGLFGISILLLSYNNDVKIPEQRITTPSIDNKKGYQAIGVSVIASGLCSFMPGLGPSQAAILGSQLTRNLGDKGFLILVGGLNTVNMVLSFIALYILDKARNGAIVVVSKILETFNINYLILFVGCTLTVAGIATFLSLNIAKIFSKIISRINYKLVSLIIMILITILVIILSGGLGLLILFVSTCVGVIPSLKGIGKNHLMGCLLLPVILHFLL